MRQAESLLNAALEQPPEVRPQFLAEVCGDDDALRREVEELLAQGLSDPFLELQDVAAQLSPGDVVGGRYRILEKVGRGGMGVVYRAHDGRLPRDIAIKILPAEALSDPEARRRFAREAKTLSLLSHAHIAILHDFDTDNGMDFLVMEFVDGQSLDEKLGDGPLPEKDIARLGSQIASALEEAHEHGIIHRDLKPANIRLTLKSQVKVLDFGIALFVGPADSDVTQTATKNPAFAGTLPYMSPEQVRGETIDARSDLYAFGIVLYEMATGQRPFREKLTATLINAILERVPPPPRQVNASVSPSLENIILKCLEKDPDDRYQSARELGIDLRRLVSGTTVPAVVQVNTTRWPRLSRQFALGAAIAATLGLAIWGWSRISGPTTSPPSPERLLRPFTTSAGEESDSRISPDGNWVSFIATERGTRRLFVQQIDQDSRQLVVLPPGDLQSHVWSPKGDAHACLVRLNQDWTLHLVPFFGNEVAQLSIDMAQPLRSAKLIRWIDRQVYFQAAGSGRTVTLQLVDLESSKVSTVNGPWDKMDARGFDVDPTGRHVVWTAVAAAQEDLWTAALTDQSPRRLTSADDKSWKRFPIWVGDGAVVYQSNRGEQTDLWQVDLKTGQSVQLTTDVDIERPESASKDGSVSFQLTSDRTALWTWGIGGGAGSTISGDRLNDFAPTASRDGRVLAFQRSRPSPVEGSLPMDSDIFMADVGDPNAQLNGRRVAIGIAPQLSPNGDWLTYSQHAVPVQPLFLLDLKTRKGPPVSTSLMPSTLAHFPVGWVGQNVAWGAPDQLFFVERSDAGPFRLMGYRVGQSRPDLLHETDGRRIGDLHPTADGRAIAFQTWTTSHANQPPTFEVHWLDLKAKKDNVIKSFVATSYAYLLGWTRDNARLVVAQSGPGATSAASDVDITLLRLDGTVERSRVIGGSSGQGSFRLIGGQDVYLIRDADGVANLWVYSLATRELRMVSRNSLLDVGFGSVEPLGSKHVVAVGHEKTRNIFLLKAKLDH